MNFNSGENKLSFSSDILDIKLPEPNSILKNSFENIIDQHLTKGDGNSEMSTQVSLFINKKLGGRLPTAQEAARKFNLSRSTLMRRLIAENTTYEKLVVQAKKKAAERLLANSEMSLGDLSVYLDFAHYSSFSRVFRAWCGVTPKQYREQNRDVS